MRCPGVPRAGTLGPVPGPRRWRPNAARRDGAHRVPANNCEHPPATRAPSRVRAPRASPRRGGEPARGWPGRGSRGLEGWRPPSKGPRGGSPACGPDAARGSLAARAALGLGVRSRIPRRLRLPAREASRMIMHILSGGGSVPGSGTPPSPVTVLDGSSAPTPPPAASCVPPAPRSLRAEQLCYFSGRRRGPEPGTAARTSEGGCWFPPVERVPVTPHPRCWTRGGAEP